MSAPGAAVRRFHAEDRIPLDEPRVRRGLAQRMADPSPGAALVADFGGALLAAACGWARGKRQGFRDDDRDLLSLALAGAGA